MPVVALVGYTNAGKSTLLECPLPGRCRSGGRQALCHPRPHHPAPEPARIKSVLVTDTVGFIRKLPPTIINAFRATLEELSEASLLLHVVDVASPDAPEQCQTVEKILGELGLADKAENHGVEQNRPPSRKRAGHRTVRDWKASSPAWALPRTRTRLSFRRLRGGASLGFWKNCLELCHDNH